MPVRTARNSPPHHTKSTRRNGPSTPPALPPPSSRTFSGMFFSPSVPHNLPIARIPPTRITTDADGSPTRGSAASFACSATTLPSSSAGRASPKNWARRAPKSGARCSTCASWACRSPAIWPRDINWKPYLIFFSLDVLGPLVSGTMFASRIHHYFRIGSTNVEAMQAAAAGEPEGAVYVAEQQTAGRGRGGHSWDSEQSVGIYCSAIVRPRCRRSTRFSSR